MGAVIRRMLGQPRMRSGIALGRLVGSWDQVVGARLARETVPVSLVGGGLVVAASSPGWAAQVRFLAEEIRRRAEQRLGSGTVRSVRVIVREDARKPLRHNASGASAGLANLPREDPPR